MYVSCSGRGFPLISLITHKAGPVSLTDVPEMSPGMPSTISADFQFKIFPAGCLLCHSPKGRFFSWVPWALRGHLPSIIPASPSLRNVTDQYFPLGNSQRNILPWQTLSTKPPILRLRPLSSCAFLFPPAYCLHPRAQFNFPLIISHHNFSQQLLDEPQVIVWFFPSHPPPAFFIFLDTFKCQSLVFP